MKIDKYWSEMSDDEKRTVKEICKYIECFEHILTTWLNDNLTLGGENEDE